jgi:anion-transporting  ArsA/GET3 family ATPase
MFCSNCGSHVNDGEHFCNNCGAALQPTGGVSQHAHAADAPPAPAPRATARKAGAGGGKPQDPYKDQIAQLRLQLKEVKLRLRELNNQISGTRSNYFEFDSFAQRGPLREIGRMVEGTQLYGPYQQRQQMREQVMQMEQQLLALQEAQQQWKMQQQQ